jgi:two-component system phosphate regulon sensor histidine kinase PhoR
VRLRLGQKLTLAYIAIVLLLAIVSAVYLRLRLQPFLFEESQKRLWHEAAMVKAVLQEQFGSDIATYEVDELADKFGRLLQLRITVIDSSGKVWGDTNLDGEILATIENHRDRPEVRMARQTGRGTAVRTSTSVNLPLLYVALLLDGDPSPGFVRLAQPLTELHQVNRAAFGLVLSGLGLGVLLAILLAIGGARRIAQPLVQMAKVADRFAKGDFSARLHVRSRDEVGDLADSLNRMAGQLQELLHQVTSERNRLQAVLDGMVEGVLVVDAGGTVQLMNASYRHMFNVEDDVVQRPLLDVVRNATLRSALDQAIRTGQPVSEEIHLLGETEKVFVVHVVPLGDLPVQAGGGAATGAVAVLHDITQLKQLERVRRDFVANVSHELRTPLAAIKGYAETLLSNVDAPAETRTQFLSVIERHANRMSNLVTDLLELARLESDREVLAMTSIELALIVRRIADEFKPAISARSLNFRTALPPSLPAVKADEGAVEQILHNLLDNAIKYTEPGGTITISAVAKEDEVQVSVADTGVGIARQHLERIFERFYRVDKARSRELGGTGLGLAIVKHLVQLHGGRVWAESEPGQGTIVHFTLLTAKPQERQDEKLDEKARLALSEDQGSPS